MPDICLCNGTGCPFKDTCYRFTAKPDELSQSYFVEVPWNGKDCIYFMPSIPSVSSKELTLEEAKMLQWVTCGKSGTDPLKIITLGEAETEHLEAIFETQPQLSRLYRKALLLILKERYQG